MTISVRLPPRYLAALDRYVAEHSTTRTEVLRRLLERGGIVGTEHPPVLSVVPSAPAPSAGCSHALTRPIAGGLHLCRQCGATYGLDKVWRR